MDYRLADGELGTALIDAIRAQAGCPVPALIVTGSSDRAVLGDIVARGPIALPKPVSPARLRAALASPCAREARSARRRPPPGPPR